MTKQVLGRGLASLIPRQQAPPAPGGRQDDGASTEVIVNIDLGKIEPNPFQPRADFDPVALEELKRSIVEQGIIQPITVRRIPSGYQLISGERRVRAAREAGLAQIPAYIIRVRSEEEMLELALVENLQREHLNPIEIAISYRRLMEECRFTQEEVSQKIGKDRTTITNFLRLLRLPEEIQAAVRKDELSMGHARALVAIDDAGVQMEIFKKTIARGLSVREVERLVRGKTRQPRAAKQVPRGSLTQITSNLSSIEDHLRQALGTKVQVRHLRDGKGEIIIEYYSNEDLNRLLDLLGGLADNQR